ncbi:MAG: hypothetical protein P1V81_17365 [Planctomycetota bacterium]|nr:hypothetical protein [Planctomycetota bacterium]
MHHRPHPTPRHRTRRRLALFALGRHAPQGAAQHHANDSTQARFVLIESRDGTLYTFATEEGTVELFGCSVGSGAW